MGQNPFVVPVRDYNLLPLDTWRQEIGYNPWHFWNLANSKVPVTSHCNSVVKKYAWQNADAAGRSDIVDAIITAEDKLNIHLNYFPAPKPREVMLEWPRFPKQDLLRLGYADASGRWEPIVVPDKHVQALGTEALSLVSAVAPVFTDDDGDGLAENFTLTFATTVTLTAEIAVYFQSGDRLGEDLSETWRIQPVRVSISGGVCTIKGKAWLLVKPLLYEGATVEANEPIDPSIATNYVTAVDVYRRYIYQDGTDYLTATIALIWESPPYPQWASVYLPTAGIDPAGVAYAIGRGVIREEESGVIGLGEAIYNTSTGTFDAVPWYASALKYRPPDRVLLRYFAGERTDTYGQMQAPLAKVVSRLAAAEMQRRICACDSANKNLYNWQFDLAQSGGVAGEAYGSFPREHLTNPFGTRRGHVEAWKYVKAKRVLKGFSV